MKIIHRIAYADFEGTMPFNDLLRDCEEYCEKNEQERKFADPVQDVFGISSKEFIIFEDTTLMLKVLLTMAWRSCTSGRARCARPATRPPCA